MTTSLCTPSFRAWRPILQGEPAERALRVVEEIAVDLRRFAAAPSILPASWLRRSGSELSLGSGWAGIALFFAYLDQARPDRGHADVALELLERAVLGASGQTVSPALYAGFPGVAWVMEHLEGRLIESEPGEDPGEEAAAAVVRHLGQTPWRRVYDLISGLAGFGVYALERWPRAAARECLTRTVAHLAETAERRPVGIAWRTPPDWLQGAELDRYPQGCFNLGVAHGAPGVIPLLAGACAAGIAEARPLVDDAVAWLLTQKLPAGAGSVFPTEAAPTPGGAPEPSYLAWCYGDLGIAAALLAAARALGEAGWEREAVELGRAAAARCAADEDPGEACLCHGAAGNGHLFNRLYQATGVPAFAAAARSWLLRALDKRHPGAPFGGFQTRAIGPQDEMGWQDEPGFLTGAAGIGLALLAAATPVEPAWDRVLLISTPRSD
ncbi:MAG TPA: lanthionine synthetase C family protein [Thermoanaerobaculia bacterium]|jgi:lantibiotic modifying enzyme|nr:lanthionine synthetase C family protein [Thermoanaerobaculia bacterium]